MPDAAPPTDDPVRPSPGLAGVSAPVESRSWQRLLQAVSRSPLIDAGSLPGAAQLVCDAAAKGLDVERCSLWLLDTDYSAMQCICLIDHADAHASNNITLSEAEFPAYFAALREERSIAVSDAPNDPRTCEFTASYLTPLRISAMLDTPIHRGGEMVGIICVEHRGGVREWRGDEFSFVGNLADLFARAMTSADRLRYQSELEELNSSLERRVDERTRSLQEALHRLETTQIQLLEREKLAALGSLVAGVAHEINTPVGVALTATTHGSDTLIGLQRAVQAGSLTKSGLNQALDLLAESLSLATRNIERAATLISSFKQTAADQTSEKRASFELGAYVDAVVATLSPMLRKRGIAIQVETAGYVTLDSYPGAIAHIVSNLVSNAANHGFSPERRDGRIRIQIRPQPDEVELEISDNGQGMEADTCRRAFEPFFTPARGRGGTGLGLSIVNSMVQQTLGGAIALDSVAGRGTSVRIVLPLCAPARESSGH